MYIRQCYKYEINGIIQVSENLPEGAVILDEMNILYAKDGYDLIRLSDNENMSNSLWLKDNDLEDNYKEELIKEESDE